MNSNFFNGRVRNRLVVILIIAIVLPLASLGYFSYNKSFKILENKLSLTAQQTVNEVDKSVNEFLSGIENQVKVLSENANFEQFNTVEEMQKKMAMELLRNTKDSNQDIMQVYFGSADGSMNIYPHKEYDSSYDPRKRPWYELAIQNKDSIGWSEPYTSASTGEMLVTASKAVINNGEVVGVIGIDIRLKELSKAISERVIGNKGYIFATDKNGIIIAHPDESLIGGDTALKQSFWNKVNSNNAGFSKYTYNKKEKFLSFATNEKTGWKLMASMEVDELLSDTDIIKKFTLYSLIFGLIISIIISFLIANNISKSLNMLKEAFKKAAGGDLTTRSDIKSKDEFGEIGYNFNLMIENINALISEVKNSSCTVLDSSVSLANITEEIAASTDEVAKTVEEVAKSTDQQARDTEDGVSKINELSDKIEMVLQSTNKMNSISKEARQLSDKGLNIVNGLTEKSKENNQATAKVSDIIEKVDGSANEIGIIISAIEQIADQTNLLALNAAIESARAGEHGRGFAVVSEEVRKLAEESGRAAKEIRNLIVGIQNQSKEAVDSIQTTKVVAESQDTAVKETENIFKDISNAVISLVENIHEIIGYSDVMDNKKTEIVDIIENIAAATQQTSASTQQVSASTEEQAASMVEVTSHAENLRILAENLEKSINKFNV